MYAAEDFGVSNLRWSRAATAFLGLSLGLAVPPASSGSCVVYLPAEAISIEIVTGKSALLNLYAIASSDEGGSCSAEIEIPFSIFPTSSLATRPADIARSMHDIVKKIGARECEVQVFYVNDTGEEIASHELCLRETFEFGERKYWSKSSESYCWDPERVELVDVEWTTLTSGLFRR